MNFHFRAPVSFAVLVVTVVACVESGGGGGGDKNCSDFDCQQDAQAWHNSHPESDLDGDGDGIACESLPSCFAASPDGSRDMVGDDVEIDSHRADASTYRSRNLQIAGEAQERVVDRHVRCAATSDAVLAVGGMWILLERLPAMNSSDEPFYATAPIDYVLTTRLADCQVHTQRLPTYGESEMAGTAEHGCVVQLLLERRVPSGESVVETRTCAWEGDTVFVPAAELVLSSGHVADHVTLNVIAAQDDIERPTVISTVLATTSIELSGAR